MKIAVTTQNFRTVTGHAGRARRFLIFDVQAGAEPALVARLDLPRELAMHDFHGDGPHPIDDVDVLLSQGFGDGFAQRMARRGILTIATDQTDPVAAVHAYLAQLGTEQRAPASQATCACGHGVGRERHGHGPHHHHHHHPAHGGSGEGKDGHG
jgi:predicted Fe-Mo cluster-binding NifX family protein